MYKEMVLQMFVGPNRGDTDFFTFGPHLGGAYSQMSAWESLWVVLGISIFFLIWGPYLALLRAY